MIRVHFHDFSVFDFISKQFPLHFTQTCYKSIFSHIHHKTINFTARHFFELFISSQRTNFIHFIVECISNRQNQTFYYGLNMTSFACVYLCCSNTTVDKIKWHTSTWRIFPFFYLFVFLFPFDALLQITDYSVKYITTTWAIILKVII